MSKQLPLLLDTHVPSFSERRKETEMYPWGNPTRNPAAGKPPATLLPMTTTQSFKEMMAKTDWENMAWARTSAAPSA